MGWRDDRSTGRYGQTPQYWDLEAAYRRLQSDCRQLEARNAQLEAHLREVTPGLEQGLEALKAARSVIETLEDESAQAQAQRDLLYEGTGVLSRMHDYEHQNGQRWCIECRYQFPCETRRIADRILLLQGVTEVGPVKTSPLFSG